MCYPLPQMWVITLLAVYYHLNIYIYIYTLIYTETGKNVSFELSQYRRRAGPSNLWLDAFFKVPLPRICMLANIDIHLYANQISHLTFFCQLICINYLIEDLLYDTQKEAMLQKQSHGYWLHDLIVALKKQVKNMSILRTIHKIIIKCKIIPEL